MRKYFEQVYKGFCNSMEKLMYFASVLAEAEKLMIVCITLPLWVIPYAIYKKVRTNHVQ